MNKKVNHNELVLKIYDRLELDRKYQGYRFYTKKVIKRILEELQNIILEEIEEGNSIDIRDFIHLTPTIYEARTFHNPQTLEKVPYPKMYRIKVFIGGGLKKACERLTDKAIKGGNQ